MRSSVRLSVKVSTGPFQNHKIDEYDFDQKLTALKENAAQHANLPTHAIDLVHHGKVLDEEKSLKDNGVKPGEVIYVLKKYIPPTPDPPKRITEIEVQECVSFFRSFRHPAESALTLLLKIRDEGHSEAFLSSMPSLANDPIAINFLREPELLAHMGDPETIRKIAEKHPALIEAIRKISGFNDPKQPYRRLYQLPTPDSDDEEDIDILGDPDDEGEDGDNQQSGLSFITPEQLSSALALAGMTANGNNSESQSSTSTAADNTVPGLREFLGSLLAADRPAEPSPSSSRSVITSDMFSNALSQAFTNASGSSNSTLLESDTSMSSEEISNSTIYADQLLKMQEMGLTDKRVNLRALIISDGDVNAAINLVLSHFT